MSRVSKLGLAVNWSISNKWLNCLLNILIVPIVPSFIYIIDDGEVKHDMNDNQELLRLN